MTARQNSTENGTDSARANPRNTSVDKRETIGMFQLLGGISLDDWDQFESGAIDQALSCDQQARVLAFGAIRRACQVARRHDHKHTEYCAEHGPSWTSPGRCEASAIRYAIRAAIARNIDHSDEKSSMGEAS